MTAIHEYPTPLTDAQAEHEWHHVPTVPASHARDLERKLALCRDALQSISDDAHGCNHPSEAIQALDATK